MTEEENTETRLQVTEATSCDGGVTDVGLLW